MNIEDLLNKYFEGKTSCEEERLLRQIFTQGIIPPHLEVYRPMFTFLNKENQESKVMTPEVVKKTIPFRRRIIYSLSSLAAVALLVLAIAGITRYYTVTPDNYVIIDGEYYTSTQVVHKEALAAFQEVSFSEDEIFETLFSE